MMDQALAHEDRLKREHAAREKRKKARRRRRDELRSVKPDWDNDAGSDGEEGRFEDKMLPGREAQENDKRTARLLKGLPADEVEGEEGEVDQAKLEHEVG